MDTRAMIHKMKFDGQCDRCSKAIYFDEIDDEGVCEDCQYIETNKDYSKFKAMYDKEVAAGIHNTTGV